MPIERSGIKKNLFITPKAYNQRRCFSSAGKSFIVSVKVPKMSKNSFFCPPKTRKRKISETHEVSTAVPEEYSTMSYKELDSRLKCKGSKKKSLKSKFKISKKRQRKRTKSLGFSEYKSEANESIISFFARDTSTPINFEVET